MLNMNSPLTKNGENFLATFVDEEGKFTWDVAEEGAELVAEASLEDTQGTLRVGASLDMYGEPVVTLDILPHSDTGASITTVTISVPESNPIWLNDEEDGYELPIELGWLEVEVSGDGFIDRKYLLPAMPDKVSTIKVWEPFDETKPDAGGEYGYPGLLDEEGAAVLERFVGGILTATVELAEDAAASASA